MLLLSVAIYAAVKGSGLAASCALPSYEVGTGVGSWMLAGILYVAYNFALAMVVLPEYQAVADRRDSVVGAALGGLLLGMVAMVCYLALMPSLPTILHYEVPMLYVAGTISVPAKIIYTIVLLLGILTTAIANAYGCAQRLSQFSGLEYRWSLMLTVTMALPLAFQNFAILVATIYPLFGVVGVIILLALLIRTGGDKLGRFSFQMGMLLARIKGG